MLARLSIIHLQSVDTSFPSSTFPTDDTTGYAHLSTVIRRNLVTETSRLPGDAVSIFGTIGPNNSRYSVQLDGTTSRTFSARKQYFAAQVLLFQANNIGDSEHSLVLQNHDQDEMLQIDYALTYVDPDRFAVTAF